MGKVEDKIRLAERIEALKPRQAAHHNRAMEHLPEILKQFGLLLAAVIAAAAAAAKYLREGTHLRSKALQERYERIRTFFEDQERSVHPLRLEAAFAAAIGFTGIPAAAIPILLAQRSPWLSISNYVAAIDHVEPDADGTKLVYRSWIAKSRGRRNTAMVVGGTVYFVFFMSAVWVLIYAMPKLITAAAWGPLFMAGGAMVVAVSAGFLGLTSAARLHLAVELVNTHRPVVAPMEGAETSA